MRTRVAMALLISVSVAAMAQDAPKCFFIGNSLTDHFLADSRSYNPNGPAIERISKLAGIENWEYKAQNIAGAPLWWLWHHHEDGGRKYKGSVRDVLGGEDWDVLCLQPHGGYGLFARQKRDTTTKGGVDIKEGEEIGDVRMAANFIQAALKNPDNRDMQVIIYSTWANAPRMKGVAKEDRPPLWTHDFEARWTRKEEPPATFTQQYFEQLVAELEKLRQTEFPELVKPIRMMPAGDVMLAIDRKLKAGEIADTNPETEPKTVFDMYDGIHVNPMGQVVVAYIFYSMLIRESPAGLDMRSLLNEPNETGWTLTDEQNRAFQEIAWEVISGHPLADIGED